MDYQGNPNKNKDKPPPEKRIEKVVTGEVTQKPKSIGRKFKEIFFGGDLKTATRFVAADVVLPAVRDLLFDAVINGTRGVVYGDSAYRRRSYEYRPTVSYHNPITTRSYESTRTWSPRDPRDPRDYRANLPDQPNRYRTQRPDRGNDIVIAQKADAEAVVEKMYDVLEKYEVVSLADFYDILGWPTSPIDNNWGWTVLRNIEIRQVRDGFMIELPPLETI